MALELLSGPHPVLLQPSGTPVPAPHPSRGLMWVDPAGLIFEQVGVGEHLVMMDGAAFHLHDDDDRHYALCMIGDDLVHPANNRRWYSTMNTATVGSSTEQTLDEVLLIPRGDHKDGPLLIDYSNTASLVDRYIRIFDNDVETYTAGAWVDECPTPATYPSFPARPSWAREDECIWFCGANGVIAKYDYLAMEFVGPVYQLGMTALGVWFSRKHNVFVSLHNNAGMAEIRVWATTVMPVSLSAPVADAAVRAGRAIPVRTQVLGAHSDPCVGEVVSWSTTGGGYMQLDTSVTDADGWARNTLVLPLATPGPSVVVNVSLEV